MNISDKIKTLNPIDLNCNVFDVYNYDGLSMQELLCQFFTKINECIKVSNETIDLASWLVNEGLKKEVAEKLILWLNDGTLENLINVNLFNTLQTKIENINSQLAHVENKQLLCPDDFEGNDFEKIRLFINYLIENNINHGFLNREYDITGYTIYLDFSDINRYIHIEGGGIIKNDDGYVFSSNINNLNRNSFTFTNTRFISSGSAILWNGNKYIRQKVENCYFNGMAFVHSDTYIQSVYVANCEISNLHSNFIDAKNCYDLNFSMNRCEASKNNLIKLVNTNTGEISFFKCRIDNNLIEGYTTSSPIILSGGYGLSITNNYFEANNYDIKFDPVGSTKYTGEISNNTFGNNRDADFNIYTTNTSINVNELDIHHNLTTLNDSNKAFTNVNIIRDNLGNNSTTGSSGNVVPKSSAYKVQNNGITPTITDSNGVTFEFRIKLGNLLWQKKNKSYLIHLNSTIAGSVVYSGFMNGIVSIHTFNTGSKGIKSCLTFKLLDGYKTNLNEISDSDFSYYFKETGDKYIDYTVNEFTIVVNIPQWLYNASYTNGNLIDLSSVNQSYYITKE